MGIPRRRRTLSTWRCPNQWQANLIWYLPQNLKDTWYLWCKYHWKTDPLPHFAQYVQIFEWWPGSEIMKQNVLEGQAIVWRDDPSFVTSHPGTQPVQGFLPTQGESAKISLQPDRKIYPVARICWRIPSTDNMFPNSCESCKSISWWIDCLYHYIIVQN